MASSDRDFAAESLLLAHELPDAEALVRDAGWNQTADDWRAFLALGSVYAIRNDTGRVIATAATLPYGGRFAWISMVLVAREHQRRGLATRLMRRCVEDLKAAGLVPVLDATPAGREVYRGLGFVDTWGFQRFARPSTNVARGAAAAAPDGLTIRTITDDIWPDLCAFDTGVFGADRSALLARLRGRAPQIERFATRDGRIVGVILGRDGRVATQIGPLVAADEETALALLDHAVGVLGGPIFIDVPDAKAATLAYLAAQGFEIQRPLTRMVLGQHTAFDDGRRTFAVAGPEFG
jgi:GNAT superfamily N-acetyltransferase